MLSERSRVRTRVLDAAIELGCPRNSGSKKKKVCFWIFLIFFNIFNIFNTF